MTLEQLRKKIDEWLAIEPELAKFPVCIWNENREEWAEAMILSMNEQPAWIRNAEGRKEFTQFMNLE